jgi:hypothetical protein
MDPFTSRVLMTTKDLQGRNRIHFGYCYGGDVNWTIQCLVHRLQRDAEVCGSYIETFLLEENLREYLFLHPYNVILAFIYENTPLKPYKLFKKSQHEMYVIYLNPPRYIKLLYPSSNTSIAYMTSQHIRSIIQPSFTRHVRDNRLSASFHLSCRRRENN